MTNVGAYEPPENLEWSAPPPKKEKQGSKWDPVAAKLKEHPGRWACLGRDHNTSITTVIKRGQLKCFQPAGSFEVRTANHTSRFTADVFVRYVGENQEYT